MNIRIAKKQFFYDYTNPKNIKVAEIAPGEYEFKGIPHPCGKGEDWWTIVGKKIGMSKEGLKRVLRDKQSGVSEM